MSISQKFLSKILIGWRAHRYPIFQGLSRIILKYSDFIFYVATTKNNKFDFGPYFVLVQYIAIQLSESFNFLRTVFFIVKRKFLDCWFARKTSQCRKRRGVHFFSQKRIHKKKLPYDFFELCRLTICKSHGTFKFPAELKFFRPF